MKIILTGGCTGGHIYPAIAIGNKFREMDPNNEVIYVANDQGLETKIIPKAGYELKLVTADWIDRSNPIRLVKTFYNMMKGRAEAYKIMKSFKPDIVVSTGSFVSVPVVLAAKKYGADIYMQEQNAFAGVSNRAFAKYARKVFLGFEKAIDQFDQKEKCIYSGNPVRSEFYNRDKVEDRKKFGIPEDDFVIMAFGGSLGAATINEIEVELVKTYGGMPGVTLILGAGRDYYDEVVKKLKDEGLDGFENVRLNPYIDGMPETLSASDVVISRAGALSVAEITMSGVAAIFVPSPNVTADHQYHNAKAVADKGGAIIVRETENTKEEAMNAIASLKEDRTLCDEMAKNSKAIAPVRATDIIYEEIMKDHARR